MASLVQAGRPMRLTTPLGGDVLVIERLKGDDYVSRPFEFTLDLLSDDPSINAAALLLTLRMEQSRGLDSAMAALRAALLRLLLAGEERTVAGVVDELGQQLPAEPLRVDRDGGQMALVAGMLHDDAAVGDVLAHINTLAARNGESR